MFRHLLIRVAVCVAAIVPGLAAPIGFAGAAAPAPNPHGVLVARGGFVIKTFTDAKCSISKRNGFLARSKRFGAQLFVHVQPFDGFDRYPLQAGQHGAPSLRTFVEFTDPVGVDFASNFIPPHPVASGGAVQFSDDGQLIGVGFQPMFNASGSDQLVVTGVMVCHYPKKKGKR